MTDVDLELLFMKARVALDQRSPDEIAHMRHEQRVSFVSGNLLMMRQELSEEEKIALRERVRVAAGPCPCGDCAKKEIT